MIVFGLVARCPAAGSGGCPIPGTRFVSAGSSDPRDRGPLPSPVFSSAAAILVNFTEPRYAARLLNAVAGGLCGCCACRTFAERGGGMSVWCCACRTFAERGGGMSVWCCACRTFAERGGGMSVWCCACRTFAERGGGMSVWCCACHVPAGRVPSSERRDLAGRQSRNCGFARGQKPTAARRASTRSVRSQEKSGSSRPK